MMMTDLKAGDWVVLERLPDSVCLEDQEDRIFVESVGRRLQVVSVEQNGDLELDGRLYSGTILSIYVPRECLRTTA